MSNTFDPTFYPAYCEHSPLSVSFGSCCTQPNPLVNEALGQCCGTLKSLKVCLSASSTVGVVGGYLSLWYSILQGIYSAIAAMYLHRQQKQSDVTKANVDDAKDRVWSDSNGEVELVREDTSMISLPVTATEDAAQPVVAPNTSNTV